MPVKRISLQSGYNATLGKITECKSKVRWLAITDNRNDTVTTVANYGYSNAILPIPYISFHPEFPLQSCRTIDFSQDPSAPCKWEIEASYSSEPLKDSDKDPDPNPLLRPATIKWKAQQYRKAIEKDRDGKALKNSAGDYFDPPVEVDASHWVAEISKNVSAVPTVILEYTDAINDSSFSIQGMTVQANVAKIVDLSISEKQDDPSFPFYIFSYSLEFRPTETWKVKVLDQGYRYKSGSNIKQILDDSSPPRPVTSPKLLDGSGGVLSNPSTATATFLEFNVYPEKDFSILPGLNEVT